MLESAAMSPVVVALLLCLCVSAQDANLYMGARDSDPWADASDTWGIPDTTATVGRVFRIALPEKDNVAGYQASCVFCSRVLPNFH